MGSVSTFSTPSEVEVDTWCGALGAIIFLDVFVDLSKMLMVNDCHHRTCPSDAVTNGGTCPVLKHGPRSLTCVRVCEF
jgi:hypothetical protein